MRRNGPVTQRELDYRDSAIILSRSDRKGIVTDVNRDFIEISGYTRAEAMGQPHNFLRHPNMPPAAFADLWRTLKRGRLWNGVIKNRAKNGDHYWVEANVAPVLDGQGKILSYVSVRTKPTRDQIAAAEARYHDIALGKARFPRHPANVRPVVYGLVAGLAAVFALLAILGVPWPAV
ncbi:MAG TPA: PAS domain-containing protein, partial [Rhodocyclaceae bacterium]|nr:PAS domain-containing protein [Rhodocyclaceae bacterium]